MKPKPILFAGPMVRAILEGRKTQTRRVLRLDVASCCTHQCGGKSKAVLSRCPYGQPGDHLWLREAHQNCPSCGGLDFAADCNKPKQCRNCDASLGKWRPAIHMFREWSRLTLEITSVRVERLQDISEQDAKAEGIEPMGLGWRDYQHTGSDIQLTADASFKSLWESINGPGSWGANPWVWVVQFKRVEVKP